MRTILEKITKASLKFLEPRSLEETYKTIVSEAVRLVRVEHGSIFLDHKGSLERVYTSLEELKSIKIRKKGFTYKTFKTKKSYVANVSQFGAIHPLAKKIGIKSTIFIPISHNNKSIGVLSLESFKAESFTKKELNALKLFGSMASLAIRNAQLHEEMKKALETRDLFISMAAHELRTPLTTISGYVQLLNQHFANSKSVESRWIKQLLWETNRLNQMMNELLEANRIKTGKINYHLQGTSVREVIKRTLDNFTFSYPKRKIVYEDKLDTTPDIIIGDSEKLQQVFSNLLDNAIKFSPENTVIKLDLRQKSHNIIIAITDCGLGISKDELSNLLAGFYGDSKNHESGLGLGLFLVKNIIKTHRGTFKIKSKPKCGTTVEVKLPKAKT